ncbi:MAG TPA: hypothetical protein VIG32_02700 [Candidatus Baltobacteraceae bacterium]|jgi:hypothetical protein
MSRLSFACEESQVRFHRVCAIAAALTVALLAGPGPARALDAPSVPPSGAQGAVLVPPPGWVKRDFEMHLGPVTITTMWVKGAGSPDNINLGNESLDAPVAVEIFAGAAKMGLEQVGGRGAVKISHTEKLCNGTQNGWLLESNLSFGTHPVDTEQVFSVGKTHAFILTYTRLQGAPEDPVARRALDTLCTT